MYRKFISLVIGTALTVTSITATSAQAGSAGNQRRSAHPTYVQPQHHNGGGNEAAAAALAGIAALFIIGKAIENNSSPRPKAHHVPRGHQKMRRGHHGHRAYRHQQRRGHWNGPRRHRH